MSATRCQGPPTALRRSLTGRQIQMIALGGALGTGLFLGSGMAFSLADPSVIVAYAIGAALALSLAYALAEMTVAHPQAGGFGALAHTYFGPWASFAQRWMYWVAQVVNVGGEVTAAGMYVRLWWPALPLWIPVAVFSILIVTINRASVRFFGEFEFWFAMVKIVAIVAFVLIGLAWITVGLPGGSPAGLAAWTEHGGFASGGLTGLWLTMTVVTFGYMGTEAVAMTAAESRDPEHVIPRATRGMVLRLALCYLLTMFVIVTVVPRGASGGGSLADSPFVRLFDTAGVPGAVTVVNAVVLTAALSAMNTNLYVSTHTVYSLAQDGYAPRRLTDLTPGGVPRDALYFSLTGLALAVVLCVLTPRSAFPLLVGLATFGALVTWLMIFATQWAFRRHRREAGLPSTVIRLRAARIIAPAAMLFVAGILVTLAFTEQFALVPLVGVPFFGLTLAAYAVLRRARTRCTARPPRTPAETAEPAPRPPPPGRSATPRPAPERGTAVAPHVSTALLTGQVPQQLALPPP
ncbi:amino acid permease [Streptomyces sp. NPDC093097]|uniref:amino acid permease n=1 Tax=Streptomyces sp. NPDC093097 TaxID=3366027 RepID=UPI0037F9CD6B